MPLYLLVIEGHPDGPDRKPIFVTSDCKIVAAIGKAITDRLCRADEKAAAERRDGHR